VSRGGPKKKGDQQGCSDSNDEDAYAGIREPGDDFFIRGD